MGNKNENINLNEKYITFRRFIKAREINLLIFIIALIVISSLISPYFFTVENINSILIAASLDIVVIVGMTIVLIGGGIDLSVGSVFGFGAAILAWCFSKGYSIALSISIAFICGLIIGSINGVLIAKVRINSLITTLGMMTIARSGVYIVLRGYALASIPQSFKNFAAGSLFRIPNLFLVGIILVIISDILLRRNTMLRQYYFVGGNENTAYLSGIKTVLLKYFSYVIVSALSIGAAILMVSRLGSAFPHSGLGMEIRIISACIIGGCSVSGGRGTIVGSFFGVILLSIINNILVLKGISVEWQGVFSGLILILAVFSDVFVNKRR